jgi:hypothetical protein
MNWLGKWWRKRQRKIDIQILWPACKQQATTLDIARNIFAAHAFNDTAWVTDFNDAEIWKFILNLN